MSRFEDALKAEIADLERQLEVNPTYVKLRATRRLLSIYSVDVNAPTTDLTEMLTDHNLSNAHVVAHVRSRQFSGNSAAAIEAAKQFVASLGRPAKTSEVLDAIAKAGVTFGGSAPQNTLSSILSKSSDFVSKRGVGWLLADALKRMTDSDVPAQETPSVISERLDDFQAEPPAQGREAVPGGGP